MIALKHAASKLWSLAEQWPRTYFGFSLAFAAVAAGVFAHKGVIDRKYPPVSLGVREVFENGHIHSTFLPVAYPYLLATAAKVGSHLGHLRYDMGMIVIQGVILLAIMLVTRLTLRRATGSDRFATTTALIVGLYPPFLVKVDHINDSNLALFGLLIVLFSAIRLRSKLTVLSALTAGAALGCALTVRPNFAPLVLLMVWVLRKTNLRVAIPLFFSTVVSMAIVYCSITGLIHGRPFFPQNGPYNLYAGFNPKTEWSLLTKLNAENSMIPDLADNGIRIKMDWGQLPDREGVQDSRDLAYREYYVKRAVDFIKANPKQAARLTFLKLMVFMAPTPDVAVDLGRDTRLKKAVRLAGKNASVLLIPVWIGLLFYSWRGGFGLESGVFVGTVVLYIIPFVLTNSDPRFRAAIEGIVLIDVARILYGIYDTRLRRDRITQSNHARWVDIAPALHESYDAGLERSLEE